MWRLFGRFGLLAPSLVLLLLFGFSVLKLIQLSLTVDGTLSFGNYVEFFARPDYIAIFLRTFWVSAAVTFFCILVGYPIAYGIWRYRGNRNYLLILVVMPWLVSIVVRTYGWMVILAPRGVINDVLAWTGLIHAPLRLMFNTTGVIIGLVHVLVPFMIIAVLSVMLQMERRLEEASMSLGGGRVYTFVHVTLPLSLPGVISGTMLIYLLSTGAIVTPILLGGIQERMIGTQIYQEVMQTFNFPKASTLAFLLLLGGLVVILPLQWLERRVSRMVGNEG